MNVRMTIWAACMLAIAVGAAGRVRADWAVSEKGAWPESWPKELEPLRGQSGTIRGSQAD